MEREREIEREKERERERTETCLFLACMIYTFAHNMFILASKIALYFYSYAN